MGVTVIGTPYSNGLDLKLAELLNAERVEAFFKRFPDGEAYVRLDEGVVRGRVVVVVHTMYPDQDRRFVEALLLAEAAKGAGASRVVVVAPYLAYARQDKRFLPGEPISVKAVLASLAMAGADVLVTVDVHKPEELAWFHGVAINVYPARLYGEVVKKLCKSLSDLIVMAPDKGALWRAKAVASSIGVSYDYLEKVRDRVTGEVSYKPKTVDVEGKDVVLVDDMITTGGTIARAARILYEQGAKNIYALCSHAILLDGALQRIKEAGVREVIGTDTVKAPPGVKVVSVAQPIADVLRRLLELLGVGYGAST